MCACVDGDAAMALPAWAVCWTGACFRVLAVQEQQSCTSVCPRLLQAHLLCTVSRPDVLDPALLRPGRLDRKIEIPLPNETARMEILKIHATKLSKHGDIDYEAVVKLAEGFNGADLRNICTEAGMFAIRDERDYCVHDDFMKAVRKLTDAKKLETTLNYDSSFGDGGQK